MHKVDRISQIEAKMRTGVLASYQFLGTDERSLAEILTADQFSVDSLGLTHQDLAKWLTACLRLAEANLGTPFAVENRFLIQIAEHKGTIACPFGDNYHALKRNVTVTNLKHNLTLCFSELNIHLIEEHGFYEGEGSPYRINPHTVVQMFGGGQLWVIS